MKVDTSDDDEEQEEDYDTGNDDDPDFMEIDSDEEMDGLIMNPADQRRRNAAANNNSNVVDLTGDSPAGSGDHRHSVRRANDFGRMNGNLSHMMQRGNMANASNNNNSDNNQGHEDFEMPDGIDIEEARQLEAAMFGIAYEAPASRRPMNMADPLPFVDMNASDEVLRARFDKYEQDLAFKESLRMDQEKENKRLLEEHKALREKEEAEAKEKKRRMEAEKHVEEAKLTLEEEPQPGEEDSLTIVIRFPNGEKLQRRFLKKHALNNIFAFIDSNSTAEPEGGPHKVLPRTYRLVAQHPKREIEFESEGTIGSIFKSSESLLVETLLA